MAVLLPHSIFFHVPKTGGAWVRSAIRRAGIRVDEIGPLPLVETVRGGVFHHCAPRDVHMRDNLRFAFVRHPLRFYQSYWCYKMQEGRKHNGFDAKCMRDTFPEFLQAVLREQPGFVSQVYKRYLGADLTLVDFIGKQEQLADDLVRALRQAGETFDEQALRATPPVNVSPSEWRERCQYTPALKAAVLESEAFALQALGYSADDLYETSSRETAAHIHPAFALH